MPADFPERDWYNPNNEHLVGAHSDRWGSHWAGEGSRLPRVLTGRFFLMAFLLPVKWLCQCGSSASASRQPKPHGE